MRTTTLVVGLAVIVLVLGGLFGVGAGPLRAESDAPLGVAGSPRASLEPVSDRTLVSTPGHRESEYTVARDPNDPRHLIVGAMDWDHETGGIACVTHTSRDGGRNWTHGTAIPGLDDAHARFDPWVAIDPQGRAHLACMDFIDLAATFTGSGSAVVMKHARSDDGGDHWRPAQEYPRRAPNANVDKDSLFAASDGTLYMCVYQQGLVITRSTDGGDTWEVPYALGDIRGNCNGFAEDINGSVYVNWFSLGGRFPFSVSGTIATRDGGDTWEEPVPVAYSERTDENPEVEFLERSLMVPAGGFGAIAAGPLTDSVFYALPSYDREADRWSYHLNRSTDGGRTYEALTHPVFPSTMCAACHPIHPLVTVDAQGRLGFQVMLAQSQGLIKEVWLAASLDEGETWLDPVMVASTGPTETYLDPDAWLPEPENAVREVAALPKDAGAASLLNSVARATRNDHMKWGGDYWGMTSTDEGFLSMWIDHSAGGVPQIWARLVEIAPT